MTRSTPHALRALFQSRELRVVAIDHGRACRLETGEDLRLGIGNCFERREELKMHGLDCSNDGDVRSHQARERLDLARMIHAELEDGEACAGWTARERQRYPPVIVVRGDRGVGLSLLAERQAQRLLGRGLSDRAGHRNDFGLRARPRRSRELAQGLQHIGHDEKRRVSRKTLLLVRADDREAGAAPARGFDEIMAVAVLPFDGEERFAGGDGTGIDGNPRNRPGQRAGWHSMHRGSHGLDRPKRPSLMPLSRQALQRPPRDR